MVSKCPIDPRKLKMTTLQSYVKFVSMTELPWTPLYTQKQQHDPRHDSSSIMYTYAMAGTILFTVLVFLLERILDERQAQAYQKTDFPVDLSMTVSKIDSIHANSSSSSNKDTSNTASQEEEKNSSSSDNNTRIDTQKPILPQLQEKFHKAQTYGTDKIQFGMFASTYNLIESISFLILGYLPYIWDISVYIGYHYMNWKGNESQHEIKITLIFLLITTMISTITSLPFELVRGGLTL